MTQRITNAMIERKCAHLNALAGMPADAWHTLADGTRESVPGVYWIGGAYGGVALYRMENTEGGVRDVFGGYYTKRELLDRMNAYTLGMRNVQEQMED